MITHAVAPQISRDASLGVIDDLIATGLHGVVIEGEEGSGKSVLAEMYAARHSTHSILLRVSGASRWAYDPYMHVQHIAERVVAILGTTSPSGDAPVQVADLQALYTRLSRRAVSSGQRALFIVDGLHEIPPDDEQFVSRLMDLVPMGMQGIAAVFTDSDPPRLQFGPAARVKSWRIIRFNLEETRRYLEPVLRDQAAADDLHRLFMGRPGSLAVAFRLLAAGATVSELTNARDGALAGLIDKEWRSLGDLDKCHKEAIALLLYARNDLSVDDVARIVCTTSSDIDTLVAKAPFIIRDQNTGILRIPSEAMRTYLASRLEHLKRNVLDAAIKDLQRQPWTRKAVEALPRFLKEAGQWEDLITLLSPERVKNELSRPDGVDPLRDTLRVGMEAAKRLKRDDDLYRFALQRSTVTELGQASTWDSHVSAALALSDFGAAVAIAESVPLRNEKLLLLTAVASAQKQQASGPTPELLGRICRLLDEVVSDEVAPDYAVDLAGRLFPFLPDRAMDLVQRATAQDAKGGSIDWALASLSFQAAARAQTDNDDSASASQELRKQIRNPETRNFVDAVVGCLTFVSAEDVLRQASTISNARDRIYFLKHWADRNRRKDHALDVTKAALDLVVATTEYSPNARDGLMIAAPLRYSPKEADSLKVVQRFDSLIGEMTKVGPTAELHRLKLLLASTVYRWRQDEGYTRFQEEYFEINAIADPAIRSECLARMLSLLRIADQQAPLEQREGLQAEVWKDLSETLGLLLSTSADHEQVLEPVVTALAMARNDLLEQVIRRANTRWRRDNLRDAAVQVAITTDMTPQSMAAIETLIAGCEHPEGVEQCIQSFWTEADLTSRSLDNPAVNISHLAGRVGQIKSPDDRVKCAARAVSALGRASRNDCVDSRVALSNILLMALPQVEDTWQATRVGLDAVSLVAHCDREFAQTILSTVKQMETERGGVSSTPPRTAIASLRLATSALAGLMVRKADTAQDAERLLVLIAQLPSAYVRTCLRNDLSMWYASAMRLDDARRIVDEAILPEVRSLVAGHNGAANQCILGAADSLFAARPATARQLFQTLTDHERDTALSRAVSGRLRRLPVNEPFVGRPDHRFNIPFEDIEEILEVLPLVTADSTLWSLGNAVIGTLVAQGAPYTPQQRAAAGTKFREYSATLFPRPGGIQHAGYAVLFRAAAAKLLGDLKEANAAAADARAVQNDSDRCFVLATIARWAKGEHREQLLNEALTVARSLPCEAERVARLCYVAEVESIIEPARARGHLKETMLLSNKCARGDMESVQRDLIDAAYRIDKELAGVLAEMVDTDDTRIAARDARRVRIKARLEHLESSSKAAEHDTEVNAQELERLPSACWEALGMLNAGRIVPQTMEAIRNRMWIAGGLPLSDAYPILAWVLGNARCRFGSSQSAVTVLRPFFEAVATVAEFAMFPDTSRMARLGSQVGADTHCVVQAGKLPSGQEFIERWIEECVDGELVICDGYFGPGDLDVLRAVLRHRPEANVRIMTSASHQKSRSTEDAFRDEWRRLSDQEPPPTEVIVAAIEGSGKSPVHDRWWLAGPHGLRIGTSLGGMGVRDAEISRLRSDEVPAVRAQLSKYLDRTARRMPDGTPLRFSSFTL